MGRVVFHSMPREQAIALKNRLEQELADNPETKTFKLWFDYDDDPRDTIEVSNEVRLIHNTYQN